MSDRIIREFNDELELKKYLDTFKLRFNCLGDDSNYVISFYDNKSGALIYQGIYKSPVGALRDLNTIIPERKIPVSDIDVFVDVGFKDNSALCIRFGYTDQTPIPKIDYHLYFKDKKEVAEAAEREIKN